jgi:hypothetical protein
LVEPRVRNVHNKLHEERHVDLRRRALESKDSDPVVDRKAFGNNVHTSHTQQWYGTYSACK